MMRGFQFGANVQAEPRQVSGNPEDRFHIFAVCGAFTIIAAIVFGTLSYHPF
jgi:hypothetical protein